MRPDIIIITQICWRHFVLIITRWETPSHLATPNRKCREQTCVYHERNNICSWHSQNITQEVAGINREHGCCIDPFDIHYICSFERTQKSYRMQKGHIWLNPEEILNVDTTWWKECAYVWYIPKLKSLYQIGKNVIFKWMIHRRLSKTPRLLSNSICAQLESNIHGWECWII